ncbi:MAG: tRNA 2-thiouridine(34) synthase MnmA [Clostridia bacterium]|nr:tRNA 2-thiouridine(34) synthase MnmA [Clostridia bacterium]
MKILVGLSGGVDSAYAALKLIRAGHAVEGAILKMHEHTDILSARTVASELCIPLHEIDVTKRFEEIVKEDLINCYLNGKTPNPCIICNEKVKFAALYEYAAENGFDRIATGHYAIVSVKNGRFAVETAPDTRKDQSYMLYRLPQNILSALVLPIGEENKADVRANSAESGVSVAGKKDSQEICFLPDGHYADYIENKMGKSPEGDFVDPAGRVLGRHKGIIRYTVGQRKGLGISLGKRAFVTDISPETNQITLSTEMTGKPEIELSSIVYSGLEPQAEATARFFEVKLRYTAPLIGCMAQMYSDGRVRLKFESPVICAPGQSAVLYDNGRVMLGGYIER